MVDEVGMQAEPQAQAEMHDETDIQSHAEM